MTVIYSHVLELNENLRAKNYQTFSCHVDGNISLVRNPLSLRQLLWTKNSSNSSAYLITDPFTTVLLNPLH